MNTTVPLLRKILKLLDLQVTGNKVILMERILTNIDNNGIKLSILKDISSELKLKTSLNKSELINNIKTRLQSDNSDSFSIECLTLAQIKSILECFDISVSTNKSNQQEILIDKICPVELEKLTLQKLKSICKVMQVKITGTKEQLIKTIIDSFGLSYKTAINEIHSSDDDSVTTGASASSSVSISISTSSVSFHELSEKEDDNSNVNDTGNINVNVKDDDNPNVNDLMNDDDTSSNENLCDDTESILIENNKVDSVLNHIKSNDIGGICTQLGLPQTGNKNNKAKTLKTYLMQSKRNLSELVIDDAFYLLLLLPDTELEKLAKKIKINTEQDRVSLIYNLYNSIDQLKLGKKTKARISNQFKREIWSNYCGEDTKSECWCCQKEIDSWTFHAGHVVSEAQGGSTDITNIRPVCTDCNYAMGSENMELYAKRVFPSSNRFDCLYGILNRKCNIINKINH